MNAKRSVRVSAALVAIGGFLALSGPFTSRAFPGLPLDSVWFYALVGVLQLGGGVGLLWTIVRGDLAESNE
ncbi:hypothetical protein [Haloarcula montana]|uniref:hypothetical protein n=1 Tax=Haloarcula montana TaxID=3111776 RepID=UPI002D7887D2|nr:hypothetical protein [Haloarcula sp. GH36]